MDARHRQRYPGSGLGDAEIPQPHRQLLTVGEAADILRTSDRTILREIKAGRLRASRVARRWLIPVEEIDRVLGV
jgi:excisionase family DNA binding protein